MTEEYKRTCEDELDWTDVQQLHEATLQISKSCFEFKKLCVGIIGVAIAILVKLTENHLDYSYFVVPLLICFGFWIADFTAYYYQRVTREKMSEKLQSIAARSSIESYTRSAIEVSWLRAAFNSSMSLYYALCAFCVIGLITYHFKWIG